MERLLITGVDTLLGSNLALALSDRCQVLGLYDHIVVRTASVATEPWSPAELHSLNSYFERWQPQWVLHCGPLASSSWEQSAEDPVLQHEPAVAAQLAELARRWGSLLTVVSSDAVFAGPRMFHDERWPTSATSPRAAQTIAAEQVLLDREALVVRTHAYGWNIDDAEPGFAADAYRQLTHGQGPAIADQRYATPILATDLAELLWKAYDKRLRGLYHMAGAERTSVQRFVTELAASCALPFHETLRVHGGEPAGNLETSLSSKRARRMLAAATPMLREGLERFAAQATDGWRTRWQNQGRIRHPVQSLAA